MASNLSYSRGGHPGQSSQTIVFIEITHASGRHEFLIQRRPTPKLAHKFIKGGFNRLIAAAGGLAGALTGTFRTALETPKLIQMVGCAFFGVVVANHLAGFSRFLLSRHYDNRFTKTHIPFNLPESFPHRTMQTLDSLTFDIVRYDIDLSNRLQQKQFARRILDVTLMDLRNDHNPLPITVFLTNDGTDTAAMAHLNTWMSNEQTRRRMLFFLVNVLYDVVNGSLQLDTIADAVRILRSFRPETVADVSAAVPGLSQGQISSIPTHLVPQDGGLDICSICHENLLDGEIATQLPSCGHIYHKLCIDSWLFISGVCPTCRARLDPFVLSGVSWFDRLEV